MNFLKWIYLFLDSDMTTPKSYGWFHLLCLALTGVFTFLLCFLYRRGMIKSVPRVILFTTITVILLEIYKQILYSVKVVDGSIQFDYQWYSFPFQFCSIPMYTGLLAGIVKKGKLYDALTAFLATYSVFGGCCVMLYPEQVFVGTVGINIQSMVCHGAMIALGIFLFYSSHVKLEHKTILKAMSVFAVSVATAIPLNEVVFLSGILKGETFNMFFFSRHFEPSLPVFSLIQPHIPYVVSIILYFTVFSAAAYLMLLAAMGIHRLAIALKSRNGNKEA